MAATLFALSSPLAAHFSVVSRKPVPEAGQAIERAADATERPAQRDTPGVGPAIAKPVSSSDSGANGGAVPAPPAATAAPVSPPLPPPSPAGDGGQVRGTHNADLAAAAAAARALRDDGDTQTSFTIPPPQPQSQRQPPPKWLTDLFGWLGGSGSWFVTGLAWFGIAVVALGILYLAVPVVREFIDGFIGRGRKISLDDEPSTTWQPDQAGARNLLAEADALANSGRYAEAVHLLLGRSLEDIANRRPGLLKPALTARAIAVMGELPAQARTAFGQIAAAVERSLWARRDLALADWQSARASYEDFAFGNHWRGTGA